LDDILMARVKYKMKARMILSSWCVPEGLSHEGPGKPACQAHKKGTLKGGAPEPRKKSTGNLKGCFRTGPPNSLIPQLGPVFMLNMIDSLFWNRAEPYLLLTYTAVSEEGAAHPYSIPEESVCFADVLPEISLSSY
jgi:hypothetical protein